MNNYRDIIIRPIITEKSMITMDAYNKVTFEVARSANKTEIKQAIESIFNVKVTAVNVVNVRPRDKRVGKYTGKTSAIKKAIVSLAEGSEIKIYE